MKLATLTIPPMVALRLCPECRHERTCDNPQITETAGGGVTCLRYEPRPDPRAKMTKAHILALPDRDPCADCACRAGTQPNGTHHSMADFMMCVDQSQPFLCHADGRGRICAGWLRAAKARQGSDTPVFNSAQDMAHSPGGWE